ncbi:hypothetical protein EBPHNEJP_00175 [Salmonella phage CF-SP2]|nr:hypothetical protein EBPHNEJP_00175 [Salmonella phage CF-SP2]
MKFEDFAKSGKSNEANRYLGLLMVSRSYFHSAHFETKSYARHKAYNFIFDELPDLIDKFGEQWLGFSGKPYVPDIPEQKTLPSDTIKMIELILTESDAIYDKIPRAIQNTVDEIVGAFYQLKYLLTLE